MEGRLELWSHRLTWGKWKKRYFILIDHVLSYCKEMGGDILGRVHMKVATLDPCPDDSRTFKIFTGVKELKLRADDEPAKQRWLTSLREAQTAVLSEEANIQSIRRVLQRAQDQQLPEDELNFFLSDEAATTLDLHLMQIFEQQAIFSSQLSALKASANPDQRRLITDLLGSSAQLKQLTNENTKLLQEERDKMVVVQEILRKRLGGAARSPERAKSLKVTLEEILVEKQDRLWSRAVESSFGDDSGFFSVMTDPAEMERVRASFSVPEQPRRSVPMIVTPRAAHPLTARLLSANPVFQAFPVEDSNARTCMPAARTQAKLDVWSLLKNNIGKDLSRITMPIYLNDPISMLQKAAEPMEFADWLRKANRCADPHLRMCYVLAFHYAAYPLSLNRLKKPFNPLLGETFELLVDDARFLAEQVSHHPPVCAFHAESEDFVLEGHLGVQATISLSGFQVCAIGPVLVTLKAHGERYVYARPKSSLHNFIVGQMYIWHSGEATLTNEATGATALLFFKPKGWGGKHDYECEGKVADGQGRTAYQLNGKWNSFLTAVAVADKAEVALYRAPAMPAEPEKNYHFTLFQLNLNHLGAELLPRLPPTDSRLRPDQRAYEHGQLDLAGAEKARLEEAQRVRRQGDAAPQPRWFAVTGGTGAGMRAEFTGAYFKAREDGQWPADLPDLFN